MAYEAVRKVDHKELITVDANGKPTIKVVEALIEYVRSSFQQEARYELQRRSSLCSTTRRSGAARTRVWLSTSFGGTEFDKLKELLKPHRSFRRHQGQFVVEVQRA